MEPEKLSVSVRDHIRGDLLDMVMLSHLEGCGIINWITTSTWQCQAVNPGGVAGGAESAWVDASLLSQYLEVGWAVMNCLGPQPTSKYWRWVGLS